MVEWEEGLGEEKSEGEFNPVVAEKLTGPRVPRVPLVSLSDKSKVEL